jgi:hypothetical protein
MLARLLPPLAPLLVVLLVAAPTAGARAGANGTIDVTFSPTGTIVVALPDGTPVGASSGPPTVIPAGYYTLIMSGPGGCTQLPLFELKGPGIDVYENMTEGEVDQTSHNVYLAPNSTYTWKNYAIPSALYTFATSGVVQGKPPTPVSSVSSGTVSSQDVVGSGLHPLRGTLAGRVTKSGTLVLSRTGKDVARLAAGRYRITVTDRSTKSGFVLRKGSRAVSLTGAGFVGTRSVPVELSTGRWYLAAAPHAKSTHSILVH